MTCDTGLGVPATVGLVADDFTGAADSAGVFTQHGWAVRLLVGPADTDREAPLTPGTVLAVATGARSLNDADAAEVTAAAVRRLSEAGVERLFLKIDSTMRGSVPAQVRGALDAWSRRHPGARAVVTPAFPALGRTVVDGVVLVDGIPVSETDSGRDPFAPVASSRLDELLPGFQPLSPASTISSMPARAYADATTDDDLDALARLIHHDPAVVAVGSAGLASALARRWQHPARASIASASRGGVVVAVTSLHPVSARQVSELAASLPSDVDVLTPPVERGPRPSDVAAELAQRVNALVKTQDVGALIVVGGDGVAAVLAAVGATAVRLDGVLDAGCPTGIIVGGLADGVRLVSKSGGFGSPSALVDLVSHLRSESPTDPVLHPVHPKEDHNV